MGRKVERIINMFYFIWSLIIILDIVAKEGNTNRNINKINILFNYIGNNNICIEKADIHKELAVVQGL